LRKLRQTLLLDHCAGNGRRRTSHSCNNISAVSFSQGSTSTRYLGEGTCFSCMCKMSFLLTAVQRL